MLHKPPINQRCVLITQNQLAEYLGSEIVTLELATFFSTHGYKVVIGTNNYERPISTEIDQLKNVWVYNINDPKLETAIDRYELEFIWVQHQLLPQFYLEQLDKYRSTKVVYHHMSAQHPLEFPFILRVEEAVADVILFNSEETKDAIQQKLGVSLPRTEVFYNAAPDEFLHSTTSAKTDPSNRRVLIVSNHIPTELREAVELLRNNSVEVTIYGYDDKVGRITPEVIAGFDTVVTIGKTVQYSILMGVPVYCYDHFGGPGYLTKSNFEKAMYHNFSGRGFRKKTGEQIATEIKQFSNANDNYYAFVPAKTYDLLTLSKRLTAVLDVAKQNHAARGAKATLPQRGDVVAGIETLSVITLLYAHYIRVRNSKNDTIRSLESELEQVKLQCTNALGELDFIHSKKPLRWAIKRYKKRR